MIKNDPIQINKNCSVQSTKNCCYPPLYLQVTSLKRLRELGSRQPPRVIALLCNRQRHKSQRLSIVNKQPAEGPTESQLVFERGLSAGFSITAQSHDCSTALPLHLGGLSASFGCRQPPRQEHHLDPYRGTSLIRNSPLLGPYGRPMPRALWGS